MQSHVAKKLLRFSGCVIQCSVWLLGLWCAVLLLCSECFKHVAMKLLRSSEKLLGHCYAVAKVFWMATKALIHRRCFFTLSN